MTTKSPRSILRLVCTAGIVAAMLFGGAVSTAFAAATLTPLGDLPGGSFYSETHGVSGDGSVVVGGGSSASGNEAFRWTSGGGMVGLGDLPGGSFYSVANSVSADGSVVVGRSYSDSGDEAFRWTSGGGMVGLGALPGGSGSRAFGVSADGSIVVGYGGVGVGSDNVTEAFRWTSGGGMVGLGTLPGRSSSWAFGISADGSVVVGSSFDPDSGGQAFRWTSGGGMVGLGTLPGGSGSSARAVSADGSVVVGVSGSSSGPRAFHWTSGRGMVELGTLPVGPFSSSSQAFGVSADGSVVVGSIFDVYTDVRAFYWTADGGIRPLWDVLLSHGVDPAADGWTELSSARGITPDGNTIVGYGTRNGRTEAFIATIPEPASLGLMLPLMAALLRRRRGTRLFEAHESPGSTNCHPETTKPRHDSEK